MSLISASESILKAIEKKFLETGKPNQLTLVHSGGQSDRDRGIQHFAHEGLLKKIIGGHWGLQPRMMKLIAENKIITYNIPQGQLAQLYRDMAGGGPGKISKVGLGTFIDPRIEGGKMNEITKFVNKLQQVSYNAKIASSKGQKIHYVTERAVFEYTSEGFMLTEIAEGIDLQTQILDLMEFKPKISPNLKTINPAIFKADGPFGLKDLLLNKSSDS